MKLSGQKSRFVSLMVGVAAIIVLVIGWVVVTDFTRQTAFGGEPALHVSEAGVHYVMHVLNSGACDPNHLATQQSMVDTIADERTDQSLGRYQLDFDVVENEWGSFVTVASQGYYNGDRRNCQTIEATLESFTGARGVQYRLLSWNHKEAACQWPDTVTPLVC